MGEVSSDALGSSWVRVPGTGGGPSLALVGHIDEIGVAITAVEDGGLLRVTTIGGISPETLLGQRIRFRTRDGEVIGTIGRRRLPPEQIRDRGRLEHADLHVDIGASDRAAAEALVRVGDAGVWTGPPVKLPDGRLLSRALDNRLGKPGDLGHLWSSRSQHRLRKPEDFQNRLQRSRSFGVRKHRR